MRRIPKLRTGAVLVVMSLVASVGVAVVTETSAGAVPPTPYSVDLHNGFGNAGPYQYGVVGGSFMSGFRGTSFSGSDEIQYTFADSSGGTLVDIDADLVGFNHAGECITVVQPFTVVNLPAGMSVNGSNICAVTNGLPNLLGTEIFVEGQESLTLDPNGGTAAERVGLDELSIGDPTTGQTGPPAPVATSISVGSQSGDYNNPTTVSANLSDGSGPVAGEQLTFTVNGSETCSGTTDGSGNASCAITPGEAAGNYSLAVAFGGDNTPSPNLLGSSASATFTVNRAPTQVVYTGVTNARYPDAFTASARLTDTDQNTPVGGRTVTFTLSGGGTCSGTTDGNGDASCPITLTQAAAIYPISASFGGDGFYQPSSGSAPFTDILGNTQIVYTGAVSGRYPDTFTAAATLTDPDPLLPGGVQPVVGRPVAFALAGGGSCTATTDASGNASCPITLTEPAALYSITASFTSDGFYKSASTISPFTELLGYSQVVYTGALTARYDDPFRASATLTDPDPLLPGGVQPIAGRFVTFTLSTGDTCTSITAADGTVSCMIIVSEPSGPWPASATYPITASFASEGYYRSASTSNTFTVTHQLDSLSYTGATEVANGYPATLSGTLLETGMLGIKPIAGRTVTFKLGSGAKAQSCSGTTDAAGSASCTITNVQQPDSPPGFTLPVTATFIGDHYFVPNSAGRSVDLLYYTGRSYAAAITPLLKFTPDTGQVTTAQWVDPHKSVVSVRASGISVSALSAEVRTGHKQSIATAGILSATIAIPKLPVIQVGAIHSASTSTCAGSGGGATIASLRIGGVVYAVAGAGPNSIIRVGGLTIVLNQQIAIPGGLTVNAISITTGLGISIVLSSATSDIHNCT